MISRKQFLGFLPVALFPKPRERIKWEEYEGECGDFIGQSIQNACGLAQVQNKHLIYNANGWIHLIYPDGYWECLLSDDQRKIGRKPPCGLHKGWIPKEGWSVYFGH